MVEAALEFAAGDLIAGHVVGEGTLICARQAKAELHDENLRISLGFMYDSHPWLVSVGFDA